MTDDDRRLDDMNTDDDKLADLDEMRRKQGVDREPRMAEITADTEEKTTMTLDETDADRLLLLDRLKERMPDLDLDQHEVGWTKLPDGNEALVVDGGGMDGGTGYFVANAPDSDDLHVVGPTTPMFPGKIACVLIHADGTRELARLIPDPLAEG